MVGSRTIEATVTRATRAWGATQRPRWVETAKLAGTFEAEAANLRLIRRWLIVVAALVVVIIGVGGATRLTESGLSITEWRPITGSIPPLSDAVWQSEFAKYKDSPQYQIMNKGMSLDAFKTIYWWEWGHRQLGRVIGLAFAMPLIGLLIARRVPRSLVLPLIGIAALIGLQGGIGWLMVASGLVDNRIAVSPYRLTLHLTVAFTILAALVWTTLRLWPVDRELVARETAMVTPGRTPALVIAAGIYLQVVLGGFVAGSRAGLTYNTWPLMDGALVPAGLGMLQPWYLNITENITTIQFNHRMLAYGIVLLAAVHVGRMWLLHSAARSSATWLAIGIGAQAALGIATLVGVTDGRIPIHLGVAHQVGASLLLIVALVHLRAFTSTHAAASGQNPL
jgi:heme a synthase